uniref:Ig-like domain-containing protein n=1 Tax=Clastoptera arizonana TaxID=38151 RepID=A0A1B6D272_9HEMI
MRLFFLIFLTYLVQAKEQLDVRIIIPPKVRAGSTVTLLCLFDMGGIPLYTVKWYRGNYEFYRYVPKERHPATAFPFHGLDIDMSGSNAHSVTLKDVPKFLSGQFTCEVSADAPTFTTQSDSANMSVIEIGVRKPLLIPESSIHYQGTPLQVNCSAQKTDPAPQISFYIDEVKVDSDLVQNLKPGMAIFFAQNMSNDPGPRWLRCEAKVHGVYHLSSASVPILLKPATDCSYLKTPTWLTYAGLLLVCKDLVQINIMLYDPF